MLERGERALGPRAFLAEPLVELVTWTQKGNEAMQALNRSLGYLDKSKVITYQGPLP